MTTPISRSAGAHQQISSDLGNPPREQQVTDIATDSRRRALVCLRRIFATRKKSDFEMSIHQGTTFS